MRKIVVKVDGRRTIVVLNKHGGIIPHSLIRTAIYTKIEQEGTPLHFYTTETVESVDSGILIPDVFLGHLQNGTQR